MNSADVVYAVVGYDTHDYTTTCWTSSVHRTREGAAAKATKMGLEMSWCEFTVEEMELEA